MKNNDFFLFDLSQMEKVQLFDNIIFGRDEGSDILVDDVEVSGSHFKIQIIDYEVYVVDLDSSNKTFLNDVALVPGQKSKLNPRDIIRVGSQEFSYSSSTVKKFKLPEMSKSLEIAKFQEESDPTLKIERLENDEIYEEGDSLPGVEVLKPKQKAETGLKALRRAKKYLDELQEVNADINEKMESLKKMRRRKIEVGAKMDQMKKILTDSEYQTVKEFENELRIHRGTTQGHNLKIKKEQDIIAKAEQAIAQAKFNISSLKSEAQASKDRFESVNHEYEIFQNKSVFENEFETLKETIKTYEALSLENKKVEVEKEIKAKTQEFKGMQSQYGAQLGSGVKKKAASE